VRLATDPNNVRYGSRLVIREGLTPTMDTVVEFNALNADRERPMRAVKDART